MSSQHKAPLAAFLLVALACMVVLVNALRSDALGSLFVAPAQSIVAGAELLPQPSFLLKAETTLVSKVEPPALGSANAAALTGAGVRASVAMPRHAAKHADNRADDHAQNRVRHAATAPAHHHHASRHRHVIRAAPAMPPAPVTPPAHVTPAAASVGTLDAPASASHEVSTGKGQDTKDTKDTKAPAVSKGGGQAAHLPAGSLGAHTSQNYGGHAGFQVADSSRPGPGHGHGWTKGDSSSHVSHAATPPTPFGFGGHGNGHGNGNAYGHGRNGH